METVTPLFEQMLDIDPGLGINTTWLKFEFREMVQEIHIACCDLCLIQIPQELLFGDETTIIPVDFGCEDADGTGDPA